MRILYISTVFPAPANNGFKMRIGSILRALKDEGHAVTLLALGETTEIDAQQTQTLPVCEETVVVPFRARSLSQGSDYWQRLAALFQKRSYAVTRFASPELRALAESRLRQERFDAVICDSVYSAINIPETALPMVLNHHNVEHMILLRYAETERNPAKSLYARLMARKLFAWETEVARRTRVNLTCSERERETLRALYPQTPTLVVPNAIDTDAYRGGAEEEPNTVIYMGGMDWFPNRDAVEYFSGSILPLLRSQVAGIQFVVAGRNPSAEFLARFATQSDISFTGTVPDMRPLIDKASVVVVPLRVGSGTRLKILEAAAMGKAIVSTSLGAEGLDFMNGQDIEIRDEPAAFAGAVAQLLRDPARRRRLGTAARETVVAKYSLPALRGALRAALQELGSKAAEPEAAAVTS